MKKILLVDATCLLYKGFYVPVFKEMKNIHGVSVNAVYPFLKSVMGIIKMNPHTERVGLFFDSPNNTFRKDQYPNYKIHRPKMDPKLYPQFEISKKLITAMGMTVIEEKQYEGDDLIASYAERFKGSEIVIASSDKDFYQLIDDQCKVYDVTKKFLVDGAFVKGKYGVEAAQFRDLLALIGDAADGVPGVKGIGPKSGAKLLAGWGSVPRIIENLEKIAPKRIMDLLIDNLEDLKVSYSLVGMRKDHVTLPIEQLGFRNFNSDLFELLKECKFFSIMQQLEGRTNLVDLK